jgi:hypothetical protein
MVSIINSLISALGSALQALLNLLPDSPFQFVYSIDNQYLNMINYFLPIKEFVACLEAYASAVLVYYVIRVPLRWAKAAGE